MFDVFGFSSRCAGEGAVQPLPPQPQGLQIPLALQERSVFFMGSQPYSVERWEKF